MSMMYKNVLLVNGMIVNWKISSNTCWDTVDTALCNSQPLKILLNNPDNITVAHEAIEYYSAEEANVIFQDNNFFKQFKIHPDIRDSIFLPYK